MIRLFINKSFWLYFLIITSLSGCATFNGGKYKDEDSNIIPLRDLFANTNTKHGFRISPDGSKLAWTEVVGTRQELFVKDTEFGTVKMIKTPFIHGEFYWGDDNRYLLLPVSNGKSRAIAQIDVNSDNMQSKLLFDGKLNVELFQQRYESDITLLYQVGSVEAGTQLYEINLSQSKKRMLPVESGNLVSALVYDGVVKARVRKEQGVRVVEMLQSGSDEFVSVLECNNYESKVELLSLDNSGYLNYLSNCQSDKYQLFRIQLNGEKSAFCNKNNNCVVDLDEVVIHPKTGIPQFAIYHDDKPKLLEIDPNSKPLVEALSLLEGTLSILSYDKEYQNITIKNSNNRGVAYFLFQFETGKLTLLEAPVMDVSDHATSKAEFVVIGTDNPTNGYYYPSQITFKNKRPAVLFLHGGPEERVYPDFDKTAVFLANRGYDVLSLNYHGSTGFGRGYKEVAYNNIQLMLDDIEKASAWLVDNKGISPSAIGLMGGSFGGYLSILAGQKEMFNCIVSINGMYDLEHTASYFVMPEPNFFDRYFSGKEKISSGSFDKFSPIKLNDISSKSILIIHSLYDQRISHMTAKEFRDKYSSESNIRFIEIEDNHFIDRWYNRLKVNREVELFLSECLGGAKGNYDYYLLAEPFIN